MARFSMRFIWSRDESIPASSRPMFLSGTSFTLALREAFERWDVALADRTPMGFEIVNEIEDLVAYTHRPRRRGSV